MSDQVKEERRAEDQDAALETAFVEGTLPDHDRRSAEETAEPAPPEVTESPVVEVVPEVPVVPEVIEAEQKPAVVSEAFPANIRTTE